ncbi:MAG: serine/threonine protein kinase [Cenarchaeum symbiont of Oopsacas minuta]|nr:serine/threonine protein kinase [Cenarchaeum symbiont of Oopsacas minuta]
MKRSFLPINDLAFEPYNAVLGYPHPTTRLVKSRIAELEKLQITSVAFWGQVRLGTLDVLGKGYSGVAVIARYKKKTIALKIRRIDSKRPTLITEAKMLSAANDLGVGPKIIAYSKNFIVMEYLDGQTVGRWAENGASSKNDILRIILEDCYKLDMGGLDHGELSRISKHAIIGKHTTLIDFEGASNKRRIANVTSASQSFFIGSYTAKMLGKICKAPRKSKLVTALRRYKENPQRSTFDELLCVMGL